MPETQIPKYSLRESGAPNDLFWIQRISPDGEQLPDIFLEPHRKDFYMLVLVKTGDSRHWVDMEPYVLQPQSFYYSAPHQVHVKEELKPVEGMLLCFSEGFMAIEENRFLIQLPLVRNPHNGHELRLSNDEYDYVDDLMGKMLQEYRQQDTWHNDVLLSYLRILLISLSRLYTRRFAETAAVPDRMLLKKYRQLIEIHYREKHEVADYASLLHLTPGHLGDVIRAQSGKTAIAHIHERILLEARRMLYHTDQSIKEIAFALGFEDASYFNRFFKRDAGSTPLAYRNATRKMYH
jgi:AraC-like DNA-binding protein